MRADAVLTDIGQVSALFGFSRSYFLADLPGIGDAVVFLHALMPHKPIGELYTVLGRAKQGKTERYRALFRHLAAHPDERLVRADGARGMVMSVFTPISHPVVFKVIRDQFAYPKDSARRTVEEKYRLVFRYDRIGRLVDAQEFRYLRFPLKQIDPALKTELLEECADTVSVDGEDLLVRHCYVERRLRPLNLYARENPFDAACAAVLDYGQAVKDLARSNIFPGDLLLKNFGVTSRGRVIFYDYDELCLLGQCRFRRVPEAREEDETRPLEEWLTVSHDDVFPELFARFLGLPDGLRSALLARASGNLRRCVVASVAGTPCGRRFDRHSAVSGVGACIHRGMKRARNMRALFQLQPLPSNRWRAAPHEERHDEKHQEDEEQDLRYAGRGAGDTAEAEYGRDQCNDEKHDGVVEHGGLLELVAPKTRGSRVSSFSEPR